MLQIVVQKNSLQNKKSCPWWQPAMERKTLEKQKFAVTTICNFHIVIQDICMDWEDNKHFMTIFCGTETWLFRKDKSNLLKYTLSHVQLAMKKTYIGLESLQQLSSALLIDIKRRWAVMFLKHVVVPRIILSVGLVLKDDNPPSITSNFFSGWVLFHGTIHCSVLQVKACP